MSRLFWMLVFYTTLVQLLSIALTLLKSRLSDVTEISIHNMLDIQWLWIHRGYVLGVVVIAVPWLMGTLMTAEAAKQLSEGTQTAVMATLAAMMVASVIAFLQFLVFQVFRSEALPPFGFNRIWINIMLFACLSCAGSFLAFDTMQRLRLP